MTTAKTTSTRARYSLEFKQEAASGLVGALQRPAPCVFNWVGVNAT